MKRVTEVVKNQVVQGSATTLQEQGVMVGQRLSYQKNEAILFPGESDYLYKVTEGLVRLYTMDDEGNGLTLRYVKPEGYFGEESLSSLPRRYFVEAVTQSVVEQITVTDVTQTDNPTLVQYYAQVVTNLYRSMHRLANKQLRSRIAAELLDLQDSALSQKGDNGEAIVKITHDDLASIVGSVRETVTKALGELSKLKAIEARYGKIALTNPELLKSIAGE